jgi:GGDEF domain-containing protein
MFTVEQAEGVSISIEELDKIMMYLERAILGSVRGVDVATKYSSKQWILVLLGTDKDQIRIVTERVMKEFYKMYDQKKVSVYYDVADLSEK